ncbi:MAG TPA: hypothetical protein VGD78_22540 [Chthoniobacterales bacterium]
MAWLRMPKSTLHLGVQLSPQGRVVIPCQLRRTLGFEPGADAVDPLLSESVMSSVNWAEVVQKTFVYGG